MGNDEITKFRLFVTNLLTTARAAYRYVHQPKFEAAFEHLDDSEIENLYVLLKDGKIDEFKSWLASAAPVEFEGLSFRALRDLCKQHNIPYWSRMDTQEMLEALRGI